jgi:hypothetical protein
MKLRSLRLAAGVAVAAGALAITLPAAVVAQPSNTSRDNCFRLGMLNNSRLVDNNRVLLLRVYGNQFYRMEFGGASCNHSGNEPIVLHPFDNNDLICHAIDVNISVRGTHEGCIPTSLTRLTPDQVAAIPP